MPPYQPNQQELERLIRAFDQVKAENDPLIVDPESHAFVSTAVYAQARKKRWSLVVGGKGAGKTALLLGYRHQEAHRFLAGSSLDILADDFPLDTLFNFFYVSAKNYETKLAESLPRGTDLPAFMQPSKLFQYAWQNSIKYCAVMAAAHQLLKEPARFDLSSNDVHTLQSARKAIGRFAGIRSAQLLSRLGNPSELVYALLIYFFETSQSVIDKAVRHETESIAVLLASITLKLTQHWRGSLTKPVAAAADLIHSRLSTHSLRVLFTLDKFDDYYDGFVRRYAANRALRPQQEFLSAVLEGLVLATRDIARDSEFDWLSGLVAIPHDKFLELHLRERVDLESEEGVWLRWTPAELFEYVNRRVAHALRLEDGEGAWTHLFPFDVTNGSVREVKEHSFLYLVRHSHWRPREIQLYLKRIFQLMADSRMPADEELFRKAVKIQSEETIREEFREEYRAEYPGLGAALKKLETAGLKSVMRFEETCDIVAKISLADAACPVHETMLRLFHLGVLGVRTVMQGARNAQTDPTVTQNRQEIAYRYHYNTLQTDPFGQGMSVAFHPMFFEYLNILHDEKFVVNHLTWDMFMSQPTSV
jgi:hypothetical protein